MTPIAIVRAFAARFADKTLRQNYWAASQLLAEIQQARSSSYAAFWMHAREDFRRYVANSVTPIAGEVCERASAAVEWVLRAQKASPDDGVSLGYFPMEADSIAGWRPSYPETTGYIITSLLRYSQTFADPIAREAALRMGRWESEIQMPSGAVQGGPVCTPVQRTAAAFNTGMVLDGWCSILEEQQDSNILTSARAAADFLVADLDEAGYYRTNGEFVSTGEIKTYTCLCAWALYRYGDIVNDDHYRQAALRSIEAALRQQKPNGWFAHNCLTRSSAPLTHTIGYALQAILEVGALARRSEFVAAVSKAMHSIQPQIHRSGYLPGRFFPDWTPAALSSCLTGSAQLAIVAFRLAELTDEKEFRTVGDRLVNFLKSLQAMSTGDSGIDGAVAGSFPIFGEYMRAGYPNWATKYYLDALLLQDRLNASVEPRPVFSSRRYDAG